MRVRREDDSIPASRVNHHRIGEAIDEARRGLSAVGAHTSISRDQHYQLSNRLAFAWWLADKGIPFVLMYIGFTRDRQIDGYFHKDSAWEHAIDTHFEDVDALRVLNSMIDIRGTLLWVIARSRDVVRTSPPRTGKQFTSSSPSRSTNRVGYDQR